MSKAERIRQMNTRQRIAAQQAAARRAEARRRMYLASGSVLAVIAVVVGLIVWRNASNSSANKTATAAETSQVNQQITSVPASTLNAVGAGTGVSRPLPTLGSPATLTSSGKPEILYVGAEYCPYCAAERWAMVVALSRFGTFSNLHLIHSSGTDVYPNTPTLTFHGSSYTSQYVSFNPVEWYGVRDSQAASNVLQKPTNAQLALMSTYDAPPYIQSNVAGSFPFVDIGNKYLVLGSQYLPSALANLSWAQVASALRDPSSAVARYVDGSANSITAAICKATPNAPAAVCSSPAVKAWARSL